jgi:hypothetical protein
LGVFLAVGGSLALDAVLQNPRVNLNLLKRDTFFRVQNKELQIS